MQLAAPLCVNCNLNRAEVDATIVNVSALGTQSIVRAESRRDDAEARPVVSGRKRWGLLRALVAEKRLRARDRTRENGGFKDLDVVVLASQHRPTWPWTQGSGAGHVAGWLWLWLYRTDTCSRAVASRPGLRPGSPAPVRKPGKQKFNGGTLPSTVSKQPTTTDLAGLPCPPLLVHAARRRYGHRETPEDRICCC
jgi:hypothetical protein